MARIRVTFYTASDDFSIEMKVGAARDWVLERAAGKELVSSSADDTPPPMPGRDPLPDGEVARWLAHFALAECTAAGLLNLRLRRGWVSLRRDQVQAVSADLVKRVADAARERRDPMGPEELWGVAPVRID